VPVLESRASGPVRAGLRPPRQDAGQSGPRALYNRGMQSLVLEFEDERALDEAIAHIWDKLGVSGEMLRQRLPEGRFRLEIVAEKTLHRSSLDKIGGRIVEG